MAIKCDPDTKPLRVRKAVLFTDLEGSTSWLYEMGPNVVFGALETHFSIIADAFSDFGGETVKRTGDGVMVVFTCLEDAIRGAIKAQQELAKVRADGANPLRLPPMRIGISAGETYKICVADAGFDYFGRVCAEASRILDLAHGHHIIIAADAIVQEEFGRDALIDDGIRFTEATRVFRKGLEEVSVCEVLYRPLNEEPKTKTFLIETGDQGLIKPQLISRSRPDIAPFSYFENSSKATPDIDKFLSKSNSFDFLHIRGIVAGSSSPFNRFIKLLSDNSFKDPVDKVRVGILNPKNEWLTQYYSEERKFSKQVTQTRIDECKKAVDIAKTKLERFSSEEKIKEWTIFLYDQVPIWRLVVTQGSVIATPYGGKERTAKNIVLFAESPTDPIFQSFVRYYEYIAANSEIYATNIEKDVSSAH